ncbi:unnamed protein product [Protopolystoma xenopodis]|uniref:Uncharacterized protein n=1 Tax=Protopolystoma xenopodis TaxID=117903 RepID=A0A448WVF8_9PLAT|nr:unnamed protein product [Protopolystoma xenopodis]
MKNAHPPASAPPLLGDAGSADVGNVDESSPRRAGMSYDETREFEHAPLALPSALALVETGQPDSVISSNHANLHMPA